MTGVGKLLEQLELHIGRENAILRLKTVARRDLDDRDALRSCLRHGARIVARMQRPKGNDVRRASFDGPPELAAFFRNGRLETIPAARERRRAVLVHIAGGFVPGREYSEDEVNRILQAVHSDHATLRRYLVDAGLLLRERGVYRRR
jgi:hypothetical protein